MLSKQSASIAYDVKGDCDNNILMGTASIDLSDLGRKKQMDSTYDIDMKEDSWIHAYPPYLSLSAYILKVDPGRMATSSTSNSDDFSEENENTSVFKFATAGAV